MRILLVSAAPPPSGGIATWTSKYLDYCKSNAIEVALVNTSMIGRRGNKTTSRRNIVDEIKRTYKILKDIFTISNSFKPEIVHFNTSCYFYGLIRDYLCISILHSKKKTIILQCHCNVPDRVDNAISLLLMKRIVKKINRVLVLNNLSKDYFRNYLNCDANVIPNFIESDIIKPHRIEQRINTIVYDGRVEEKKGCREIIYAAKQLENIKFELVGTISDEIKIMNYPPNVELTGTVSQDIVMNKLYHADVFLFPSYSEGFSMSLLEAMRAGLPVIVTDVGANKDMIGDGGGVIIKPKSVDEIVNAINIIDDISTREKMSIRNQNIVRNKYSTENVLSQMMQIYNETLNTNSKGLKNDNN